MEKKGKKERVERQLVREIRGEGTGEGLEAVGRKNARPFKRKEEKRKKKKERRKKKLNDKILIDMNKIK